MVPIGRYSNAFHVGRGLIGMKPAGPDAPDKTVVIVYIKHKQAVAAVFEVVAHAGGGDVEEASGVGGAVGRAGFRRGYQGGDAAGENRNEERSAR